LKKTLNWRLQACASPHTLSLFYKRKVPFLYGAARVRNKRQKMTHLPLLPSFSFLTFLFFFSFIWSHARWLSSNFFFLLSFLFGLLQNSFFLFIFLFFWNSLERLGQRCAQANRSECTCFSVSLQFHIKIVVFSQ
jgi:hypothetical protein